MANNIVEFLIRIKNSNEKIIEKTTTQFNKAKAASEKLNVSAKKLPLTIADYRGELAALEQKRAFAKTESEIRRLNGTIATTQKRLQRLETLPPNGFFTRLKRAATALTGLSFGDLGVTFAVMQTKRMVAESVKLYDIQKKAEAQLQASLESTGYSAGKTFQELTTQASALQKKTIFGDESIIKAQSVLLTFKSVRGAIFDQAMPAVLDLASKMGGDLQGAVVQVGKALQDPIMGVTALRRVGIQFSKDQEEALKNLVGTGRLEEAQLIILNELQSQFGGSAVAAAKAGLGPMQQLTNAWGDFKEKIGGTALKVANVILPTLQSIVAWMDRNGHALKNTVKIALLAAGSFTAFKIAVAATTAIGKAHTAMLFMKRVALVAMNRGLKSAIIGMKAFNAVTKANVIGLVVAGLTAAVTAFVAFRKRGQEATKVLKEAAAAGAEYYAAEKRFIEIQFALLEKTNAGSKERNELIDALIERYPSINKQLETELRTSNDLNKSKATMIELIKQQAMTEGYKKILTQKSEELADAEVKADIEAGQNEKIEAQAKEDRAAISQFASPEANAGGTFGSVVGEMLQTSTKEQDNRDKIARELKEIEKVLGSKNIGFSGIINNTINPVTNLTTDLTTDHEKDLDSITGGGKQVKNFYITIGNILGENNNYFQSAQDDPEAAEGFLDKVSVALQMAVNDINYAAS